MPRISPNNYNPAVEFARLVAAFLIVIGHANPDQLILPGQISLMFFLVLTGYLAGGSMLRAKGRYNLAARARKLIPVLTLGWIGFFIIRWVVSDAPFAWVTNVWSLLAGPEYHLWFPTFLLMISVTVQPVGRFINSDRRLALVLAGLFFLSFPLFLAHFGGHAPFPLSQWAFSTPLFLLGLIWSIAEERGKSQWILPVTLAISLIAVLISNGQANDAIFMPLAPAIIFILQRVRIGSRNWSWMGRYAFGIYLLHPAAILIGFKLFGADADRMPLGVFAYGLSFAALFVMQRLTPQFRLA